MKTEVKPKALPKNFNKVGYAAFVATGIIYIAMKDFSQASMFFGIGLIFDPFDEQTPFPQRPFYQRACLIIHLSITLGLVIFMLVGKK